jgi:hypothetical protein
MPLPNGKQCKAHSKSTGVQCKNLAVIGYEVCRLHGAGNKATPAGRPPISNRYGARIPAHIAELAETFKEGDQLSIFDELALQRALFSQYLNRFQKGINPTLADLDYLNGWLSEITRTVERIIKIRNSTALTAAEVAFIASRIPEVVAKYIHDPEQQKRFVDELYGITPSTPTDLIQLSEYTSATEDE